MDKYTSITVKESSYWKLVELKVKLKAKTWEEFVDRLYDKLAEVKE